LSTLLTEKCVDIIGNNVVLEVEELGSVVVVELVNLHHFFLSGIGQKTRPLPKTLFTTISYRSRSAVTVIFKNLALAGSMFVGAIFTSGDAI